MDGAATIEFHRSVLLRLLMGLFEAAGMTPKGAPPVRLPKAVRLLITRVLLPAESAAKRLILFVSRRIALPPKAERSSSGRAGKAKAAESGAARKSRACPPCFWLFDKRPFIPELTDKSRKPRRGPGPWISDFDSNRSGQRPLISEKPARDPDDATRLCRRMLALYLALNDLEGQARRLLRIMAKRKEAPPGPKRYGPMRSGFPPGYRHNRTHEVDEILYECHMMAWFDEPPQRPPP